MNTVQRGRIFEKQAEKILKKMFFKVEPLYNRRLKSDFFVYDEENNRLRVECKSSNGEYATSIALGEKDIGADLIFLKLYNQAILYRKEYTFDLKPINKKHIYKKLPTELNNIELLKKIKKELK